jgi:hypothetical protein
VLAANGGVLFLDKVSPALEQVDSSLGVLGTVVDRLHYDDLEDNPQAYLDQVTRFIGIPRPGRLSTASDY